MTVLLVPRSAGVRSSESKILSQFLPFMGGEIDIQDMT